MNAQFNTSFNLFGLKIEELPVIAVVLASFVAGIVFSFIVYIMNYLHRTRKTKVSEREKKVKSKEKASAEEEKQKRELEKQEQAALKAQEKEQAKAEKGSSRLKKFLPGKSEEESTGTGSSGQVT
jgi:flagellar biosynthesis/type III secretory pathway M-ring protein FliF/YscJ